MFRIFPMPYYWTARQSEWAIDFMFRSRQELAALYSPLTRGAIECFSCEDILRFLGRKGEGLDWVDPASTTCVGALVAYLETRISSYTTGKVLFFSTRVETV